MDKAAWIEKARVALALQDRYQTERIRFYKPCSVKHEAFHKSKALIRIFFGGNRSGKSYAGLMELLFHACLTYHPFTKELNKPMGRYRIFTTKYQIAEELIIPLLQTFIPKGCLINGKWKDSFEERYHILHLANGTIIDIMTYDSDIVGTASVELDGVWADEEMPQRMFSETITRLISRKGRFWMTVTPLYNLSWALKYWKQPVDFNVETFSVSIHDNSYLPELTKHQIIEQWPVNERAAREKGEFLEFQGLVYKELRRDIHLIVPDAKHPYFHWPVIMAMDPHQRKATVITWAYVDPQGSVIFFDELEMRGTVKQVIQAIRDKEATHNARTLLRVIDPASDKQISGFGSETTTLREFQNAGMNFSLADNSEAGYSVVHEYLYWDDSKELSVMNHPSCYFTYGVSKTWDAMNNLLWDDWHGHPDLKDDKERIKDFRKDFPDCVRYTLAMRPGSMQSANPKPLGNIAGRRLTTPLQRSAA